MFTLFEQLQVYFFALVHFVKMDKHLGLKDLQTLNYTVIEANGELFKVESCSNPNVDNEGNKDCQRQDFLL